MLQPSPSGISSVPCSGQRRWRVVLWPAVFLANTLIASAGAAETAAVAYVRRLDGTARITSSRGERDAEAFAPIAPGDIVVVQDGTALLCDMRNGEEITLHAGQRYTPARVVPNVKVSLFARLREALDGLMQEPEQDASAEVRAPTGSGAVWPNRCRFAPGAPIRFKWPAALSADRLGSETRPIFESRHPTPPLRWPPDLRPLPGEYEWSLLDGGAQPLSAGRFTILSEAEAAEQKAAYAAEAPATFDARERDLAIELLAAKDRCFFH
jgi:hypothetical protein